MAGLTGGWEAALREEFAKPYYRDLYRNVMDAYKNSTVYPPASQIYTAFHLTPLENVKAVILGQDPYHEPGQAEGLAFSVPEGVEIPPSLVNIFQELHDDIGCPIPKSGDLRPWAERGVLLLNSVLTVRAHRAFSHAGFGWQSFTDAAIRAVDTVDRPIVFILWGKSAQDKSMLITNPKRLVIRSPHPSPLSAYRGFFGSRPFSKANAWLEAQGEEPIDWSL